MRNTAMLLFVPLLAMSAIGLGASYVDPDEIHALPLAQRLESLGFVERPKDEGIYEKTNVALNVFLDWFGMTERDLEDTPSSPPNKWVRMVAIEGCRTVLQCTTGAYVRIASNTPVAVSVDLGLYRPKTVWEGMTEDRFVKSLEVAGAKRMADASNDGTNKGSIVRFVLPDGKGVEAFVKNPNYDPRLKPSSPYLTSLTVGEEGQGFVDWEKQQTQHVSELSIAEYRQGRYQGWFWRYYGDVVLPRELLQTYTNLVAALESGKQAEIEKFCITGTIKITTSPRPKDEQNYGNDINLPFLKDGFSKRIMNLRKDNDTEYLIRTGSTAFWFSKDKDGRWKLSKYLDKPIE